MVPEPGSTDRDAAVRTMLIERVTRPNDAPAMRLAPMRMRSGLVTAVVLAVIVAISVLAVRLGSERGAPAQGGLPAATAPGIPTPTTPAGTILGRYTSADGPNQTHTIHPNGLAIATSFACEGTGGYLVSIAHDSEFGAVDAAGQPAGRCDGSTGGSGNKGHAGSTTVKITSAKGTRWALVIVGIPETYVTPRPIATPTDSAGAAVRYCTADDLSARFAARSMPEGVTEVSGGDLVFTNRSSTTCALAGYPEVRFLDGDEPLGQNTMNHIDERSSTEKGLRAVIVRPGGVAYSQIDWYLSNFYPENEEGRCDALPATRVQVDLAYDLSSPGQTGTLDVSIGKATACRNGAHGVFGKYGQLSSTVFVDYANTGKG